MLFENKNDFIEVLNTFGIDMSNLVGMHKHGKDEKFEKEKNSFVSVEEGFQKGSMYKHEYKPYKNMNYIKLVPKSDKEAKMFEVMAYEFALTDLSFHLDLHPDDKHSFELFKQYAADYKKTKDEYEKMYGPLCIEDTCGEVYDWVDNPWPWDRDKGDMYV